MTIPIGFIYIERMTTFRTRSTTTLLGLALAGMLFAACGGSSSSSSTTTTSAKATTASASSIPPGTVLRVGEQLQNLKTVLSITGQDQKFPYTVQYSEFVGGPPMLQAFQGGALDVGFVYSTPLIFAQSAGQTITAVAGWASEGSGYALASSPTDHSISGWAGLKGKRVAYQEGTASQTVLLEGLKSAGLSLSDITSVNLPTTQIAAALQGGSADAGITVEPLLSVYLEANPTAHVIAYGTKTIDRASFLIATGAALGNSAKSAAIADYIGRLVKAYQYLNAHPQTAIQAVFIDQYHLSPARAAEVAKRLGPSSFLQLPGDVLADQQEAADLYFAAGQIPRKINVAEQFDPRFNGLVASLEAS